MHKVNQLTYYIAPILSATLLPRLALAALPVFAPTVEDLVVVVMCPIARYIFNIALIVGVFMALVAAYRYLTSGGEPTKVSEAHKTITYAAVGIAVAILAGSVPFLVGSFLHYEDVRAC